jgi:hypothetical protein
VLNLVSDIKGGAENLRVREQGAEESIWTEEIRWGGMDWVDVPQLKDRCRAVVNMVVSLRVS